MLESSIQALALWSLLEFLFSWLVWRGIYPFHAGVMGRAVSWDGQDKGWGGTWLDGFENCHLA